MYRQAASSRGITGGWGSTPLPSFPIWEFEDKPKDNITTNMVLSHIGQLPFQPELAIIINVDTKAVTTLALLSSLRHTEVRTLLVDCESRDGSAVWFRRLLEDYSFYLLSAPLRTHGQTLDWILSNVNADRVLLIDSDVEVLNNEIVRNIRMMLNAHVQ